MLCFADRNDPPPTKTVGPLLDVPQRAATVRIAALSTMSSVMFWSPQVKLSGFHIFTGHVLPHTQTTLL